MATPAAADGAGGGGGGGTDGGDKKKKKGTAPGATPSLKDCANCGAAEGLQPVQDHVLLQRQVPEAPLEGGRAQAALRGEGGSERGKSDE
jgi:hypothetical protein